MSGGNNPSGAGRTLGGDPAEPLPESWAQRSSAPRVGRIGDWSGSSSSGYVSYAYTASWKHLIGPSEVEMRQAVADSGLFQV